MSTPFCKENFYRELEKMNILPTDTVLINLNIEKFGLIHGFKRADYVSLFKEYFEKKGTFIALAFTKLKYSLNKKNLPYFDGTQSATTGAFANAMLQDTDAKRSMHPSNSVVAIGVNATAFTSGLDENKGAYDFVKKLISFNGKVLIIGMGEYPGFVTHAVEAELTLYKQYWDRFFLKAQLPQKVFTRMDPGGCSKTFYRLYPEYIKQEALYAGFVNNGYALSISAKKAYDIDMQVIKKNPNLLICNNSDCAKCRVFRWKTIWNLPFFVFRKILHKKIRRKRCK